VELRFDVTQRRPQPHMCGWPARFSGIFFQNSLQWKYGLNYTLTNSIGKQGKTGRPNASKGPEPAFLEKNSRNSGAACPICEFTGEAVNGHGFTSTMSRLRHTRGAYCLKQFLKGFLRCRLLEHMAPLRSLSASRRLQLIWRSFRLIEGKVGLAFAPLASPPAPERR
jgi:hypothetical protein